MARDERPDLSTGTPADARSSAPLVSRRLLLRRSAAVLGAASLTPVLAACDVPLLTKKLPDEIPVQSPEQALQRLLEGNARFRHGTQSHRNESAERRTALLDAQLPFAQILTCSDSRVPPEVVFDRGLGDLLVARTAGHVVDGSVMGSLEYGAYVLEIPLLLVLGHSGCDMVQATLSSQVGGVKVDGHLGTVYDALRAAISPEDLAAMPSNELAMADPAATAAPAADPSADTTAAADTTADGAPAKKKAKKLDPVDDAVHRHVTMTVQKVLTSPRIAERVQKGRLLVIGGVYVQKTGRIQLTDNVPEKFLPAPPTAPTPTT